MMSRFYRLLMKMESALFLHVNIRWNHKWLSVLFLILSIMGEAVFSLGVSLAAALMAPPPWDRVGWQSLASVALSHVPVQLTKRSAPRQRPYQVFPQANTRRNPLKDPSFPSGHTTAAFALLTPWMLAEPKLIPVFLPVAIGVGLSRIYFGLHYPSDTVAGALLGSFTALFVALFF
jgi:undecaprenyl-diphosphatase